MWGATLATGPLADRYGPRRFGLIGNALIVVGLVMLALADGYNAVLTASLVLGLGAGMLDMVLSPIVGVLKPGEPLIRDELAALVLLHGLDADGDHRGRGALF